MTLIIACDPGISGAFATMKQGRILAVDDMPTLSIQVSGKNRSLVDENGVHALLCDLINRYAEAGEDVHFVLEEVGVRPKEGAVGAFSFGRGYGAVRGIATGLGLTRTYVAPATWSRALKLKKGKDANRQRAMEMFPGVKEAFLRMKDDGRADAALIAYWATHYVKGVE